MKSVARAMVLMISEIFDIMGISPKKNTDVSNLIIRMFAYSAIKMRANIPPLYSTLNPDTSSDSPSAKSNGVRFVSARFVINQKMNIREIMIAGHDNMCDDIIDKSIFL